MRLSTIFLLGTSLVIGCAASQESDSESESGAIGASVAIGPQWQWGEVPRQVHGAILTNRGADADPIVTDRVQYWFSAIDKRVRAALTGSAQAQIANVPLPRAFVVAGRPDAFSQQVPVCYDVPVWFTNVAPKQMIPVTDVLFTKLQRAGIGKPGDRTIQHLAKRNPETCGARSLAKSDVEDLVKWSNALSTCQLKRVDNPAHPSGSAVVLGSGCDAAASAAVATGKQGASSLRLLTTSNWITVTTGIISQFSREEELVAVLAHELGHYYQAHLFLEPSRRDFFYSELTNSLPQAPQPPQDAGTLNELNRIASSYRAGVAMAGLAKVAGQTLSSAVLPASIGLAALARKGACGSDAACTKTCQPLFDMLDAKDLQGDPRATKGYFESDFPREALPATKQLAYANYEKALLECGGIINVSSTPLPGSASLSPSSVSIALSSFPLPALSTEPTGTLVDVLHTVDAAVGKRLDDFDQAQKDAVRLRFGYYTVEQEADNLGTEHLALIGLSPSNAMKMSLTDGAVTEKAKPVDFGSVSSVACAALAASDFTGVPYMFPGVLSDPHHTHCYRAYNMSRYIKARTLTADPHPVAIPASPRWADVLKKSAGP